jgi:hypothetical protein
MSRLAVHAAPAVMALTTTLAAVVGAAAQPARERLDGFQEMRFGMSLDQARQTLGTSSRDSSRKSQGGRTLAMLVAKASFEGQALGAAYVFGNGDRLALVRLIPPSLVMNTDAAACTNWGKQMVAMLTKKFGAPDTTRGGTGNTTTIYRFKDGNEITVVADMFPVGCTAALQFVTPEARDGKY